MAAANPQELAASFAAAISSRNLGAALEMWSEDAAIVGPDGTLIEGREAIAEVLRALVSNGARVKAEVTGLYEAGELALATGTLTLSGEGEDGPYEQRSNSMVVYVRGADGLWRIGIDAPWGLGPNGAGRPPR